MISADFFVIPVKSLTTKERVLLKICAILLEALWALWALGRSQLSFLALKPQNHGFITGKICINVGRIRPLTL